MEKIEYKDLSVRQFAEIVGISLPETIDGTVKCKRILTQSMYVEPGDIVISAGWYSHKQIIREALEKGAYIVLCDSESKKSFPQKNVVAADDPLDCVTRFEKWRASFCTAKRITITGSVGKTTTTGLINAVIANSFHTLTHHTMSNSHGAILRNVQRLDPSHEYWVQEVGGVQPGYVESSARFLCPDIVVLTNIGESHLNLYGTKENIFYDKSSLERFAQPGGVVVINYDDEILRNAKYSHRVVTCSKSDSRADYYAENIRTEMDGTHFVAVCGEERCEVHLKLYGEHNVYDALSAVAVGRLAGVSMKKIAELLETYEPSGMRQNLVHVGGYNFFVDTFNAEPKTVLGAAETLMQIPVPENGRRIFISGHIDKIGDASARLHEELGHELAKLKLDKVALFAGDGEFTYKAMVADGCTNVFYTDSREEIDNWLRANITRDDIAFFKSGQFKCAMAKSIDHVFGTSFQNEQQFNEGRVVERDGFKFRLRQDNIAELCGYSGSKQDIVIPERYDDYEVVRIAPFAFTRQRNLRSVTIPDTVVSIGQEAFYICPKLEKLELPASLKIIDKNAFNYCKALKSLEIPYGTIHIDRRAFYDCLSLESVSIPETVGYFGEKVFGADISALKKKMKIICTPGSLAEKYANEQKIPVLYADLKAAVSKEEVSRAEKKTEMPGKASINIDDEESLLKCFEIIAEKRPRDAARVLNTMLERKSNDEKIRNILKLCQNELKVSSAPLSSDELAQVKDVWGSLYDDGIVKPDWASMYKQKTGEFHPDMIGNDLHMYYVEKKLVDTTYIRGLCDKNIMPLVTPTIKHPETLIRKLSGYYLDKDFNHIDEETAIKYLYDNRASGSVIKQCRSSGGKGVDFVSAETTVEEIRDALRRTPYVTVQAIVKQHPDMARMNPSSVNTVRIMTILIDGESQVVSAVVRIGSKGSRVDNFHSGGMSCGINKDGTLKEYATYVDGERAYVHKNGFVFASGRIPNYEHICEEVKKMHYCLPMFGIVSWDICIDEDGEPELIEYNIGGGVTLHQLNNGPLYGEYREKIIDKAFDGYSVKGATLDYSYQISKNGATILRGGVETESITIPAFIEKKPLYDIAKEAFSGNARLKSITVNGNPQVVRYLSFYKCKSLETVYFTGAARVIDRSAFNSCPELREVVLSEGTKRIGKYAFASCPKLRFLDIPESVDEIADDAFYQSPNVLLYCKKDSYAMNYAKSKNLFYVVKQ